MTRVRIEAIEYALPQRIETNDDLAREHPEWGFDRLEARTGVLARHIAGAEETALDLAHLACGKMFSENDLVRAEIDAIIFCTETPDYQIPQNSALLHARLDLPPSVLSFDINLGCSGYPYGLEICRSLIVSGVAHNVLFATADTYSRLIHPGDRATRVLFGDGGAVTLLGSSTEDSGIIDTALATAGKEYERFIVRAGGARTPRTSATAQTKQDRSGNTRSSENIEMDGFGVLAFFNSVVPAAVNDLLSRNKISVGDVDAFVFHQASAAALDSLQRQLKISDDTMIRDMADTGNLVSASIPVALKRAQMRGEISQGDLVVLCGFGVGLSWGTTLLRI